ncbi:hypothetical protein F383_26510 [Gossypium arboreum]|uniref:Uncharacterized protein n=1 Tax=Gossypium arboreum TaxID=29729 RepID=A0A0B0PG17_GOSAR|nr:hypothetical protein F383_17080 [Gossypium arboreum]KHG22301.1 hypothetical protein F383_26510 [Gossypium arboreum]
MHVSNICVAKLPCNPPISELRLTSTSLGVHIHK